MQMQMTRIQKTLKIKKFYARFSQRIILIDILKNLMIKFYTIPKNRHILIKIIKIKRNESN